MTTNGPEVDAFGGVTGRVLRETMATRTLATGSVLVLVFGSLGYILSRLGTPDAFPVFLQLGITLALARFALNGLVGEWGGTIFSSRGGSWWDASIVALRYLALSLIWILPVLALGWRPQEIGSAVGDAMMGMGGAGVLSLSTLVAALVGLTPPVFLIAAVGAAGFGDLVSRDYWRGLFRGRLGDLFLIYALYLGGMTMTALLFLPLITATLFQSRGFGVFLGLVGLTFGAGLGVSLLGRLCGFFAGLERPSEDWGAAPAPLPPDSGATPRTNPAAGTTPLVAPRAPTSSPARSGAPKAPAPAAHPRPVSAAAPAEAGGSLNPSGKTPLLDARPRVDAAEARFESDPQGAIEDLEELREHYAPHVLVMHLMTLLQARMGRVEESLRTAREALPLCLERGAVRLAAEIYATHLDRAAEFKIPRDTILTLADDLRRSGNFGPAEESYTKLLEKDRNERRAVKGLLQVAEAWLENSDYLHARDIYRFLLERCPDSPLAAYMEEGLAEAERRLAKAS